MITRPSIFVPGLQRRRKPKMWPTMPAEMQLLENEDRKKATRARKDKWLVMKNWSSGKGRKTCLADNLAAPDDDVEEDEPFDGPR